MREWRPAGGLFVYTGDVLRWTFPVASAVSLVLCVTVTVVWVRSYCAWDMLTRTVIGHRPNAVYDPDDPFYLSVEETRAVRSITLIRGYAAASFQITGGSVLREDFLSLPKEQSAGVHYAWGSAERVENDWGFPWTRRTTFEFPLWPFTVAFAVMPLMRWTIPLIRRRAMRRAGRCPVCGYDLRASPERCPECGAVVLQSAPARPPGG